MAVQAIHQPQRVAIRQLLVRLHLLVAVAVGTRAIQAQPLEQLVALVGLVVAVLRTAVRNRGALATRQALRRHKEIMAVMELNLPETLLAAVGVARLP